MDVISNEMFIKIFDELEIGDLMPFLEINGIKELIIYTILKKIRNLDYIDVIDILNKYPVSEEFLIEPLLTKLKEILDVFLFQELPSSFESDKLFSVVLDYILSHRNEFEQLSDTSDYPITGSDIDLILARILDKRTFSRSIKTLLKYINELEYDINLINDYDGITILDYAYRVPSYKDIIEILREKGAKKAKELNISIDYIIENLCNQSYRETIEDINLYLYLYNSISNEDYERLYQAAVEENNQPIINFLVKYRDYKS